MNDVSKPFGLLRYFTGASLLVILVAVVFVGLASGWLVHVSFLHMERDEADSLAENMVTFLDEEGFGIEQWSAGEVVPDELRARLRARLENFGIREFTLFSADGRVLQDFGRERDSDRPAWDHGMREALRGRVTIRWEAGSRWPLMFLRPDTSGEVETYGPVGRERSVTAVARVRRNLTPVLARAHDTLPSLLGFALAGGAVMFGALWLIVRRADRQLNEQYRALLDAQRELALHVRLLEELNRHKDDFYTMCSTDLRGPLLAVRAGCKTLLDDRSDVFGSEHRSVLEECLRNNETVLDLIDNLLELASLESGDDSVRLEQVEVAGLIKNVVSAHKVLADGLDARIRTRLPGSEVVVFGDRSKIIRALSLLLSYCIGRARGGVVTVGIENGPDEARVAVTDPGPVLPPEEREALFESPPDGGGPSGPMTRGLPIVRDLLEVQGGSLSVSNEPEGATTFLLSLRKRVEEAA